MTIVDTGHRYAFYNREERALCSHLFRLLHEDLVSRPDDCPLRQMLRLLRKGLIQNENALAAFMADGKDSEKAKAAVISALDALTDEEVARARLYPEAALVRDARVARRRRLLPAPIGNAPESSNTVLDQLEGSWHLRCAKPDLLITVGPLLLVFEAKFTGGFSKEQWERAGDIAKAWRSALYYDLGFASPPLTLVTTLGDEHSRRSLLTWQDLAGIAEAFYGADSADPTPESFMNAVRLLDLLHERRKAQVREARSLMGVFGEEAVAEFLARWEESELDLEETPDAYVVHLDGEADAFSKFLHLLRPLLESPLLARKPRVSIPPAEPTVRERHLALNSGFYAALFAYADGRPHLRLTGEGNMALRAPHRQVASQGLSICTFIGNDVLIRRER